MYKMRLQISFALLIFILFIKMHRSLLCFFILNVLYVYGSKYGDKKLNEWTWITAHNANLNWDDGGIIDQAGSQKYSIDKQLKIGVRGFMLDISNRVCTPLEKMFAACSCEGICLCHGECNGILIKDGFNNQPYTYVLRKIVRFLKKNPEEIVFIFLENYVNSSTRLYKSYKSVDGLMNLIFNPNDPKWNVTGKGWPKINDMIKANKRLLIVDDEKRAPHADFIPGIIRSRDFVLQNNFEWFKDKYEWPVSVNETTIENRTVFLSRCYSLHKWYGDPVWSNDTILNLKTREHRGQPPNGQKLFLLNNFLGIGIVQMSVDPLTVKLMNTKEFIMTRIKEKCNPGINNVRPNFIALDFIEPSDVESLNNAFNNT